MNGKVVQLIREFKLDPAALRECSFAFSTKQPMDGWRAFSASISSEIPFYIIEAPSTKSSAIYPFLSGINKESFISIAVMDDLVLVVMKKRGNDKNGTVRLALRKEEDFERAKSAMRRIDLNSDILTAHSTLARAVELLQKDTGRQFVNLGLLSNYFLRNRLKSYLSSRGRSVDKEAAAFFRKWNGEIPAGRSGVIELLNALGYSLKPAKGEATKGQHEEYRLSRGETSSEAVCIYADTTSFDTRISTESVPSHQAVSALQRFRWVILTNGMLWRLYSSRASAASTNYFEIDIGSVASEDDDRLKYYVSLFSSLSIVQKGGITDIDSIYDGGLKYASEIEDELKRKVFGGALFTNLVKAVLSFSGSENYPEESLEKAKGLALRLLYRILFILYAESRQLLPVGNANYDEISLERMKQRLSEYAAIPDGHQLWSSLKRLFESISHGNPEASVPEYDGELFRNDEKIDGLAIGNRYLAEALKELTTSDGRGIDYQNLGVRHLGSLYEGLLEYRVNQAKTDLIVYKDQLLDAGFAADHKAKPSSMISKGDMYLSIGGLVRKGTGSYYTPDEIVKFLVRKGLQPIFDTRERLLKKHMHELRSGARDESSLAATIISDLLDIRIVDPAMGSGHFLVSAVDQITSWVIERLNDFPDAPLAELIEEDRRKVILYQQSKGIEIDAALLTDSVILKRLVMKRCVYGVDINPLAVELAKLSLWLDSFTIGTPLTFLDHHIRCGDSLMGLRLNDVRSSTLQKTLDGWTSAMAANGESVAHAINATADLTPEEVKRSRETYYAVRSGSEDAKSLLDLKTAILLNDEFSGKIPVNTLMILEFLRNGDSTRPAWWQGVDEALKFAHSYNAFHWEIEFPDAFSETAKGFDLVIANPPWDAVKPEDDDFFSTYEPRFRNIGSKPEKKKVMEKLLTDEQIRRRYEKYRQSISTRLEFHKNSGVYKRRGTGDTNLWKLFLELALTLQAANGNLAIVLPSSIVTDEGGKQLREALFEGNISLLYEFENKKGIFPDIDTRYKFVLLVFDKSKKSESIPAAFYLHDIASLEGKGEKEKFVTISKEHVRLCAPNSLSIPEVRNEKQLRVFSKLYRSHPLLGDETKGWSVALVRELDRTNDSDLFRTDGKGWPLIEGKNFHQFIPDYEKPVYTVDPEKGLERTSRHREFKTRNEFIHENVRLAFRNVARGTDVRSMISCILPPKSFSPHSAGIVVLSNNDLDNETRYFPIVTYLAAILNSYVFDFLLRERVSMNLSFFYIYQTPTPSDTTGNLARRIEYISSILSSQSDKYATFASVFNIRPRHLTMRERIELLAELNALVAKHYGLNRDELSIVLDSFEGFKEDSSILELEDEVAWSDDIIRKLNGEVRKRVLPFFDSIGPTEDE